MKYSMINNGLLLFAVAAAAAALVDADAAGAWPGFMLYPETTQSLTKIINK